jgi:hypothetical protein
MRYNFMLLYAVHNIIFQYPVSLANDLICRAELVEQIPVVLSVCCLATC